MKKIHDYFLSLDWYRIWHENPQHKNFHYLCLLLFISFFTFSIIGVASSTKPDVVGTVGKKHTTGYIPDDPKILRKIPRVVATKDKTKLEPAPGELLIPLASLVSLPASVSLVTPPVGIQGGEFSCVAFATASARSIEEYYTKGATAFSEAINILSPEYLYNQAKAGFGGECSSGSGIFSSLNILKNQGISTWQSMPYTSVNGCETMPNSEQMTEAVGFKIGSYAIVNQNDQETIKTLLASNHPLIAGTSIDNNFTYAEPGFIWKSFNGQFGTNHAYTIVGYDDSKHAYKILNSWGTGWGDGGFSWIDYDFFGQLPGSVYTIVLPTSTDVTPPSVSMKSPQDNATVFDTIVFEATASDNVTVVGVRFRVDGITIGVEDTMAPYSIPWNTSVLSPGAHTVVAIARDTTGNLSASAPIAITVTSGDTTAPSSVTIGTPLNNAWITTTSTPIAVGAIDNGLIKTISFNILSDGYGYNIFAIDTEPSFIFPWTKEGSVTITATATDFAGNKLTSAPTTFTLAPPAGITSVQLSSIEQTAAGISWWTDRSADSLVEYGPTVSYGMQVRDTAFVSQHHAIDLVNLTPGTLYHYRVKSMTPLGTVSVSADYTFTTTNAVDTTNPSVLITSPQDGQSVAGINVVSATAIDNIGVNQVQFFIDGNTTPFFSDSIPPYQGDMNTSGLQNGNHTYTAKAYDTAGNSAISAPVTVLVANTLDTIAPIVSIISPTQGSTVSSNSSTIILASAQDNIGVIQKVEFFVGTKLTCTDTTTPFACTWKVPKTVNKLYSLTAKAFDMAGNSALSSAVVVKSIK